jgi:hypothetical protein
MRSMNSITLKFDWGDFKPSGIVKVTSVGASVIHELSFLGRPVATFEKRADESDDEGETRLIEGNELVGKGNLLSGVLLWLGLNEVKKERAHKAAFRDFLRDWISSF